MAGYGLFSSGANELNLKTTTTEKQIRLTVAVRVDLEHGISGLQVWCSID